MAKIYKTTDRIEIKIGDITVKISPLSLHQKNEVQKMMLEGQKAQDLQMLNEAILLAIKYCLKDLKGVEDSEGKEYSLEFDQGMITDSCINDLMNMEHSEGLTKVCAAFVSGVPKSFDIEGVSIVEKKQQGIS